MKKIALIITLLLASLSLFAQSVIVTANLSGRNVKTDKLLIPEYDFAESGIVVVNIEVDREGKVVNAMAGADGTTLKSTNCGQNVEKPPKRLNLKLRKMPKRPSMVLLLTLSSLD